MRDHLRRRIWSAQAGVLLPFAYRILKSLIARHQDVLAKRVSPERPFIKKYGSGEVEVIDYWKLDLSSTIFSKLRRTSALLPRSPKILTVQSQDLRGIPRTWAL
jgi:hypothetical protein